MKIVWEQKWADAEVVETDEEVKRQSVVWVNVEVVRSQRSVENDKEQKCKVYAQVEVVDEERETQKDSKRRNTKKQLSKATIVDEVAV